MKTKIKSVWYIFVEVMNKRRRLGSWLWLPLFYWSAMKICITKDNEIFEVEVASGLLLVDNMMFRGGSRAAATSKLECFVIIVNGWKPLTIIAKRSILDAAAAVDPPLMLTRVTNMQWRRRHENVKKSLLNRSRSVFLYDRNLPFTEFRKGCCGILR